jgi:putative N6-adenine-specific DNA methylase
MPMGGVLDLFAVTAPGIEELAAAELAALGIEAAPEQGGVAWRGSVADLHRANLHLRTASRVLVRVAAFRARTFFELERHAKRIEWGRFLEGGAPARLRVTSRKSALYHEGAIAERFAAAIEQATGGTATRGRGEEEGEEETDATAQLFVIRFVRDRCLVSADSSGALLHRRGYRQAVARAPLRETLAAALLLSCDWRGSVPLLDPFCGSGTIAIEAALLARRVPPGLATTDHAPRDFAFLHWPDFEEGVWRSVLAEATVEIRERAGVSIHGSDRDAGAIEAARTNAERAGVAGDITFETQPLSAGEPPADAGWIVTNPPYGVRVGEQAPLRDLYATLGKWKRSRLPGWSLCMLSADPALERQTGLPLRVVLRTRNGGIEVRVVHTG